MQVDWELIAEHLPMTTHIARRRIPPLLVSEAVTEVGLDTLIACSKLWDGSTTFSTYAWAALQNSYTTWLKKRLTKHKREFEYLRARGDVQFLYLGDPVSESLAVDHRDHVQWLMSGLDKYQRTLLVLRFWAGMPIKEIGLRLDESERSVARHLRSVIRLCKEKSCE